MLLVIVVFLLFYFVLRGAVNLLDLPKNYRRWRITKGHKKSEYYLTQGYLALFEGNWHRAEKLLSKGAGYSRLPMINYIGAARAAQKQGAIERRDSYLRQAYSDDPESEFAVGLARAELQMNQDQTEQAYATLRHIDIDRPGQNQVKLLLLEASSELNDWDQSLAILQDLEKKGALPVEKIRAKQLQVYAELLNTAARSGQVDDLKSAWNAVPNRLKKEFYLMEVYIRGRLNYPDTTDCEVMLRRIIRQNPDPALVRLYGQVQGENPAKQLSFMENVLKDHPTQGSVQLTAGRLYKRAELWGKARVCLEKGLQLEPAAETYYELATLFKQQGDNDNANRYFQKGLTLAANPSQATILSQPANVLKLPTKELGVSE
jgi:HemY protein